MLRVCVVVLVSAILFMGSCNGEVVFNPDNNHCYEFATVYGTVDWQNAFNYSTNSSYQNLTGYLVTITTEAENIFVYNITGGASIWTAGAPFDTNANFAWTDGPEKGLNISLGLFPANCQQEYCGWALNQPNSTSIFPIIQFGNAEWDDVSPNQHYYFVIEYGDNANNCSVSPSASPSASASATVSNTPSASVTVSTTPSATGSQSETPSATVTLSETPSATATISETPSATGSASLSSSGTPSSSASASASHSASASTTPSPSTSFSSSTTPSPSTSFSSSGSLPASGIVVNPDTVKKCRRKCTKKCKRKLPITFTKRQLKRCVKKCTIKRKCYGY